MSALLVGHGPNAEASPSPGRIAIPSDDGADSGDDLAPADAPAPGDGTGDGTGGGTGGGTEDGTEDGGRAQLLRNITDHMDTLQQLVETGTLSEKVYIDVCNVLKVGVNASKPRESSMADGHDAVSGARSVIANVRDAMDSIREVIEEERANYEAQLVCATQSLDELKAKFDRLSKRRDHYAKRAHVLETFMSGKNIPATEISAAYASAGILQAVQESDERRKRRKVSISGASSSAEGATRTPAASPEGSPRQVRTSHLHRVSHPAVVELSDDE